MAPKLSEQLPTIFLDAAKLGAGEMHYNASVIDYGGKTLLAYRIHPQDRWNCRIHIAEINEAGEVLEDYALELPEPLERTNLEDPRLFIFRGNLWLGWTQAEYIEGSRRWNCLQKYGRIEGNKIVEHYSPRYGKNCGNKKEKNWVFFEYNSRLMAVYSHLPQIVIELDGDAVVNEWKTRGAPWGWGFPSGGTSPVLDGDKYVTFLHSYEPIQTYSRQYFMGAIEFEAHPPFAVKRLSAEPLLTATDKEIVRPDGWRCLVVFPCGAVKRGDIWRVSIGVNDLSIALVDVKDLLLVDLNSNHNPEIMRIKLKSPVGVNGRGRKAGEILDLPSNTARDLIARGRAFALPSLQEESAPAPAAAPAAKPRRKKEPATPQA